MGCYISKTIQPPTIVKELNSTRLREIIKTQLGFNNPELSDRMYEIYLKQDVERFLNETKVDYTGYISEKYDCDDFAKVLLGEERQWSRSTKTNCSSTFGIVHGNLVQDGKARPHAVNFFVDEHEQLWLVEPQNDKIFKPKPEYSIWFVFC